VNLADDEDVLALGLFHELEEEHRAAGSVLAPGEDLAERKGVNRRATFVGDLDTAAEDLSAALEPTPFQTVADEFDSSVHGFLRSRFRIG
jgi:hypothetical protein